MFGEEDRIRSHRSRANLIGNFIIFCFAIVVARLWFLQVYKGKLLLKYSIQNRLRKEAVEATRGMVYSRNNYLMVHNTPRFDAIVIPQYLKNKDIILPELGKMLSMDIESINKIIKNNSNLARYKPITIKKNISRKEVALIETENYKMPGVGVETVISREYADGEIGAHLLGYIAEINQTQLPKYRKRDNFNYRQGDFIGQFGLEEELDLILRGENGYEFVEVDAIGRKKRHINIDNLFKGIENRTAFPGNNIRLTIDRDLQIAAFNALEGKDGSAVAVDVKTGEILAMVSRPSFDPSKFSRGITTEYWDSLINNEKRPLRDRVIQEHYPPGSVFKIITAIAALEEGIVDEKTEVPCPGYFVLGRRRFNCWRQHGHGNVGINKAIRESCDVYFYKIATKLDIDVLAKYARMFGFGSKTGVDLPREVSGLIPSKEWKKKNRGEDWILGETLSCVIGQSYVLSSPLQMAMAYAAIANGGKLFKPTIVKEVFTNAGTVISKEDAPVPKSELNLKKKTLDLVRQGLYDVVNNPKGTVWWRRGEGIHMAGKTGTSQVIRMSTEKLFEKCENQEFKYRHHGLFVGFAPFEDPKIAVTAVVEHGCSGSKEAAPVAVAVISEFMKKYYPEEHEIYKQKDKDLNKKHWLEQKKLKAESEEAEETIIPNVDAVTGGD